MESIVPGYNRREVIFEKGAAFLHTAIKRIEVHPPEVVVEYVLPLKTPKAERLIREVLPLEQCGCPNWTPDELHNLKKYTYL